MNSLWLAVWAGLVAVVFVAGLSVGSPYTEDKKQVLSGQDYALPRPFPVRLPGVVDPPIKARHALLIDADSFYPLYKREAYTTVPVASTTKMMTALVVLDLLGLEEEVTISREAVFQIGSSTGLLVGEVLTVDSLLKALLIQSGNDAAYALAEKTGTVEDFVSQMNAKAKSLGMKSTEFFDPAGLDDRGRSTAFDLSILAREVINRKELTAITVTPKITVTSTDGRHSHDLTNSNRLVTEEMYFSGAIGLKTGFTPGAGHVLAAAATREGRTLISVILFTDEDTKEASAKESRKLLEWGFNSHYWVSK